VALVQDATAIIDSGLDVGDEVVTDGQMSLKPGSLVKVRTAVGGGSPIANDSLEPTPRAMQVRAHRPSPAAKS
jgi:hypothetical protein